MPLLKTKMNSIKAHENIPTLQRVTHLKLHRALNSNRWILRPSRLWIKALGTILSCMNDHRLLIRRSPRNKTTSNSRVHSRRVCRGTGGRRLSSILRGRTIRVRSRIKPPASSKKTRSTLPSKNKKPTPSKCVASTLTPFSPRKKAPLKSSSSQLSLLTSLEFRQQ